MDAATPPTILVVDDVAVNRRLGAARLGAQGFAVRLAENGVEALAICRDEPIDLVLLAAGMPRVDGFETCRRLKSDEATRHVPVVIVASDDESRDNDRARAVGADDLLSTSVVGPPLFARIDALLRLKTAIARLAAQVQTEASLPDGVAADADDERLIRRSRVAVLAQTAEVSVCLHRALRTSVFVKSHTVSDTLIGDARMGRIDAVVVDLVGERIDVMDLIGRVRAEPAGADVPIVLVTSPFDDEKTAEALRSGADDRCQRPIDRGELQSTLCRHLLRRSLELRLNATGSQAPPADTDRLSRRYLGARRSFMRA